MRTNHVIMTALTALLLCAAIATAGFPEAPVDLGSAGNFTILSEKGISAIPSCSVIGDVGVSPIGSTAITGFTLILDGSGTFSKSTQVTGKIYAFDYTDPTPANMTTAIGDMLTAYLDAEGRSEPTSTELGAGNISGLTIPPGLHKWGTSLLLTTAVTLAGSPTDVWIFQIAGDLTLDPGANVLLSGGAKAENIFWQVGGGAGAVMDTTTHIEGIILSKTAVIMNTGSSCNGRLYAQTAVTLDQSQVVNPLTSSHGLSSLTIQAVSGEQMLLELTSTPGNTYWVEYKDDLLEGRWRVASEFLQATTNLTQWTAFGPLPQKRYYRAFEMTP